MKANTIAVALVHHPVLNRLGESSTTSITPMDVHDFARSCAFYGIEKVYLIHPAKGMQAMVHDLTAYWQTGEGGVRNTGRKKVLQSICVVHSLQEAQQAGDYQLWMTSAQPGDGKVIEPSELPKTTGNHLIVFGTGCGLDMKKLSNVSSTENRWLSPIVGMGKVRHLSVRAALAIYLDRLGMI
ncbi:MAG: RNA methyltransferase [Mariprofundaceae bacterium]|nr:RNA methyltransferase [Mariprofundaceae bacterium]